ncbi:high-affinity nicotinic acid transporter [Colletotrichum tofieldiae]|nr:high-affinity nicotinic acid transporter [Colletotrichum tofieldiae]GKT89395.1 high-affinity nicotinic acid transporter [Colletotrichum tofieldiae]
MGHQTASLGRISSPDEDDSLLKIAHRKVDRRLLLWYSFVYLIMRIHVSNISNAAIINLEEGTGIRKQLGNLSSSQWAWALSVFYYPYMFFEPLATLALKKFSPSIWMSRIMVTWTQGFFYACGMFSGTISGLLDSEREVVIADLPEQAPTMNAKTVNFQQIKELFHNPTFIPFLMIWITHGIGGWGISFVLPTVIYELGISNTAISQVMTMVRNSSA